jgi:UDP-glucose 4-epimerase
MKTLVVGGAGFIGSHLCDALLHQGHKVVCVDNFSLGTKQNIAHLVDKDDFILYEADASEMEQLDAVFEKEKPEYVFHLAANSDIQASAKNPDVEYRNTYTTTFHVLSCMRKHGVNKLFFASTSAVYGDKRDAALDENTPGLAPISYYGAAKLGSEALISAFSYMNDIQALVFRFPNVIGPRLTHGVIFDFINKLDQDNTKLEILGDGRQTKPYIYVADLVDATIRFMDTRESGVSLYNLGVTGDTSVIRIADLLCEEMKLSGVTYHFTGGEGGWKGDVPRFTYCLDKIHATGWRAEYTSDEAVRKTIRAVLAERNQVSYE